MYKVLKDDGKINNELKYNIAIYQNAHFIHQNGESLRQLRLRDIATIFLVLVCGGFFLFCFFFSTCL